MQGPYKTEIQHEKQKLAMMITFNSSEAVSKSHIKHLNIQNEEIVLRIIYMMMKNAYIFFLMTERPTDKMSLLYYTDLWFSPFRFKQTDSSNYRTTTIKNLCM